MEEAIPDKENIELARLGKVLKNVPKYISMLQLTDEVLAKAKSDIEAQLSSEGKPEKIWDKIVPGKLSRFVSDNTTLDQEMCLLDQDFIKDETPLILSDNPNAVDIIEFSSYNKGIEILIKYEVSI